MHQELNQAGIKCCENTVAKLMKQEGIRARVAPKFKVVTTDSKHDLPIAPNRLDQAFQAQKPNEVWLTDFTYIQRKEASATSAPCRISIHAKSSAGPSESTSTPTWPSKLSIKRLHCESRGGLIVHSDRGSQFASLAYRNRLDRHAFLQSMSRKGNCWDNAPMESFFKSFKTRRSIKTDTNPSRRCSRSNKLHRTVLQFEPFALGFGLPKPVGFRTVPRIVRIRIGRLKSAFVGAIRRSLTPAKRVFERSAWRPTMVTEKAVISPTPLLVNSK